MLCMELNMQCKMLFVPTQNPYMPPTALCSVCSLCVRPTSSGTMCHTVLHDAAAGKPPACKTVFDVDWLPTLLGGVKSEVE